MRLEKDVLQINYTYVVNQRKYDVNTCGENLYW